MKNILVPVDFTDVSKYGTQLAVKVATYLHAKIYFLNVITLPSHILLTNDGEIFEDGDFDTSEVKKRKAENSQKMQQWLNSYFPAGESIVVYGSINDQILKQANKINADLIVLGTQTNSGVKELINPTHGEYIAMHANMPVLSLKCDRSDMEVKSIVLASSFRIDDVPHADVAIMLQKAFNAKMYLLRVNTPGDMMADGEAEKHMKAFADKYNLENYEICTYNDHNVEDGIVHFVAKHDVDIITIGSKQRTGLNKLINGCVSADLVNHVYKPILTFKLKD
ncbi:MAG: universal stress protein [Bacteroidia bacterium]